MRSLRLTTSVGLTVILAVISPYSSIGAPSDRYNISPDSLPAPGTTFPKEMDPQFVSAPSGFLPKVPPGFTVSFFASAPELHHVRRLQVAPNGDVFLSEQGPGTLTRDADGDGKAELVTTFAKGFLQPHGLAFHGGSLYVADVQAIWRLPYRDGDIVASGPRQPLTQVPNLRPLGWHSTREIVFDSKGKLYFAIGARGAVLDNGPPPDASISEVTPEGKLETFASGIRNAVGLAFYPGTDNLWATVNERDGLGARLPPDFFAQVRKGDFFGWPYSYIGQHPDPVFGARRPELVANSRMPEILFEAHSALLGLVFYEGSQFPPEYRGDAFVALHGSGPYDKPTGYKVVRVKFTNGGPLAGYEDFVTGFFADARRAKVLYPKMFGDDGRASSAGPSADGSASQPPYVWGTPAGLAVAKTVVS